MNEVLVICSVYFYRTSLIIFITRLIPFSSVPYLPAVWMAWWISGVRPSKITLFCVVQIVPMIAPFMSAPVKCMWVWPLSCSNNILNSFPPWTIQLPWWKINEIYDWYWSNVGLEMKISNNVNVVRNNTKC